MVLTADRKTERKQGIIFSLPAAAGAHVYSGSLVSVDANGFVLPAQDTAGHRFIGIARRETNNSTGANGDIMVEGYLVGLFEMSASGITQADLGAEVYVVDDATVGRGISAQPVNVTGVVIERTPLTNGGVKALSYTAVGNLLAFDGGTGVAVSVDGLYTLTAPDGSTVRASVTAASLPVADASDNLTFRHVKAGRCIEVVTATSVFIDVSTAARS